tara:strand:- start:152 stop:442 length:291 start_codon:yes stop_codon:yes gene_type:complete
MFFADNGRSKLACSTLGAPEDWIIAYQACFISHIKDADDVDKHLDSGLDLESAVNAATIDVELPPGWRLVGLRNPGGDAGSERKYGLVDFNSLGAK